MPTYCRLSYLVTAFAFIAFTAFLAVTAVPVAAAGNASFSLTPAEGSATGAEALDVTIYADSGDVAVNAVEPELRFNPAHLQLQGVDGAGSGYDVAAPVSSTDDSVRIPRGKAQPGLTGRHKVATVKFRVVGNAAGTNLTFGDKSAILTLDGAANIWNGKSEAGRYDLSQPAERGSAPVNAGNGYPVAVVVQDKQGVSIKGAAVTLGDGRTATTDAKGVAGFMNVPEGQYDATVTRDGETSRRSVTVQKSEDNKVQEHAFTLAAASTKAVRVPYALIAIITAVVAVAALAAWRWHKKIVAHHISQASAAKTTEK